MATQLSSLARSGIVPAQRAQAWAFGALVAVLFLQLPVLLYRAINWDEFHHYGLVHQLADGTLSMPLQTLFTRAFVWATALPGTGVDHIVVIRLFMLACELVTLAAIAAMASRFSDRVTGLLCALAYLSAGYVFQHGTSFRFDPPATALLMSALWILLCRPLDVRAIVAAGLLVGTAEMLTIKAVLYAPAFAGVLWLRWSEHGLARGYLLRAALTGVAAVAAFAAIYLLHSLGLGAQAGQEAQSTLGSSAAKMFSIGYQPYWPHALKGAAMAPALTIMILLVPFLLRRGERAGAERVALAGLYLPVTTLLFYHNTAPYYFIFMLAPVAVACAVVVPAAVRRYGVQLMAAVFLLNAAAVLAVEPRGVIDRQRQLQRAADGIFAEPVAYFDSYSMLSGYPKANAFMTPWGIELYLAGAQPSLRDVMARRTVPLVVDDGSMFTLAMTTREPDPNFLPADLAALRSSYVPFWGPFWIAGKLVPADGREHAEEFLVPGPYTVRDASVVVDGAIRRPGELVRLGRGVHRLQAASATAGRLVWGERLTQPATPVPDPPYWTDF